MGSPPESQPELAQRVVRTPQQARSRLTRQRVLEAAIRCFEANGFEDTTTAMIAADAGVAVGSVYGYFADKRAILLELLDTTMREDAEEVIARLDPKRWRGGDDPRAWTGSLIDAVFHTTRQRPGISRILWERYFKDPAFTEPFEALRTRLIDAIAAFLQAVANEGHCRPIGDPRNAAFVILNAVQWNATQAVYLGDPEMIDAASIETAEMISRYLFVED